VDFRIFLEEFWAEQALPLQLILYIGFQGTWVQFKKGGTVPHLFPPKFDFISCVQGF
jgi:hypothetical protein